MTAHLIGRTGAAASLDIALAEFVRLGAAPDNEVRINADGVSRTHARVSREGEQYWIEDAKSTNGTFVNGQRIERYRLRHLDVVTLGRTIDLIFLEHRTAGARPPVTPSAIHSAAITWLDGPDEGLHVVLNRGEILVGRIAACTLVVESRAVSRTHARMLYSPDEILLQDFDSANGTFVNNERITGTTPLRNGDVVSLGGGRRFRIEIQGHPRAMREPTIEVEPGPMFDQEWRTRLIWSATELVDIDAVATPARGTPAPGGPASAPSPPPPQATAPSPPPPAAPPPPTIATPAPPAAPPPPTIAASAPPPAPPIPPIPPAAPPPPTPAADMRPGDATRRPSTPRATPIGVPPSVAAAAAGTLPAEAPAAPQSQTGSITGVRLTGDGRSFTVGLGVSPIGRGDTAVIRVDSMDLSRLHARLEVTPTEVTVEDPGSANGTMVNGETIQGRRRLENGDRVSFGLLAFRVEILRGEGSAS